jgi:NAD(P)-dependent dehydrogenase (short-subunit alcohol dehydrogenase family)
VSWSALHDRVAIVAGGDTTFGSELAAGLEDAGATVHVTPGRVAAADDALAAFTPFAPVDVLVHVPFDNAALTRAVLAATGEADWDARCEAVLRSALWSCQAAHDVMAERGGGRIVLVTSTAGMVGRAERVALATAAEGMRSLAKVAARQWGIVGITVNCVAVAVDPDAGGPLPPALGRQLDVRRDVGAAVSLLASESAGALTGVTIPVDGGVVMTT